MVLGKNDIIQHIIDSCEMEELCDRLGYDIETLARKLAPDILDNLSAFEDIYSEDEDDTYDENEWN